LAQGLTFYDPQKHGPYGGTHNPGVACLSHEALALWHLGSPDQALQKIHQALTLARELAHPLSLARALDLASWIHHFRREGQAAREQAEATVTFCAEQGFPFYWAHGTIAQGWALAEQGQGEEGMAQLQQGLAAYQATGSELFRPYHLALWAAVYGKVGQAEDGLPLLAEARAAVDKTGERWCEAELYRLKGELTLQQFKVQGSKFKVEERSESGARSSESKEDSPGSSVQSLESEAEDCFLKAIAIARGQQAKSLELRAVMSLARLWQRQGKYHAARNTLFEIYNWFTEGFETADLKEARALLKELEG
jgi:predicted ATPase